MEQTEPRLVVIDCETTGFSRYDRIVEIAVVTLDPRTFEPVDEYDTLINPERDLGPVGVHGITASMVEAAPVFGEVSAAVARRIDGATLVAHNLLFDTRMLAYEFERLGVAFDGGAGLCTLRATGDKLGIACARFGIELNLLHRALADARATAQLAGHFAADMRPDARAATVGHIVDSPVHERCAGKRRGPHSATWPASSPTHTTRLPTKALLQYLDALDRVLDDRRIDERERAELVELADSLDISPSSARKRTARTWRRSSPRPDAMASSPKRSAASSSRSPIRSTSPMSPFPRSQGFRRASNLRQGMHVCFTGEAIVRGTVDWQAGVGTTCRMRRPATRAIGHEEGMRPSSRGRSFEPVR